RDRAGQVRKVIDALARNPAPAVTGDAGDVSPSVASRATSVAGYPETRGLTSPGSPGSRPPPRQESAEAAPRFIESVPDAEIEKLLLDTVTRFGGTGTEDLVKRVSRELGFQRLGPHIKE